MPTFLAWLVLLVPAAFASWSIAGLVLRLREHRRLVATTLVPAAGVSCYLYADYWSKRVASAEPGWDVVFALISVLAGSSTLPATLPVYWLAEKFLGGRAA